jgi:hypothetical protein
MFIIWFLIPSSPFFKKLFYFSIILLGTFLVWVHFHPLYFLFVGEDPFDGGYVSDDLGEHTYEDSNDWDKHGSYFGPNGIQKMTIELFGQLDRIELHWRRHAKRKERQKRPK